MAPRAKITLELAKALQLREAGHTDKNIAKGIGRDDAAYISNTLFAWVKRQKLLVRRGVMWGQLLELIDADKVDHEPDARRLVAARAAGGTWDPDTVDLFDGGDGGASQRNAPQHEDKQSIAPQRNAPPHVGRKPIEAHRIASPFTGKQVAVLQRIAEREMERSAIRRSGGKAIPFSGRMDPAVFAALKEYADAEQVTVTEALTRAVESYLTRAGVTAHADGQEAADHG